jgi:hypothetical protein
MSWLRWTGFVRNSLAPRSIMSTAVAGSLSPVIAITGTSGWVARMASSVLAPLMPHMCRSRITAEGTPDASAARQASPPGRRTARNPASSTQSPTSARRHSSSSTTKTVGQASSGPVRGRSGAISRRSSSTIAAASPDMGETLQDSFQSTRRAIGATRRSGERPPEIPDLPRDFLRGGRGASPFPHGCSKQRVPETRCKRRQRESDRAWSLRPSAWRAASSRAGSEANSSARRMKEAARARAKSPSPRASSMWSSS